jgi:hypothetical protein
VTPELLTFVTTPWRDARASLRRLTDFLATQPPPRRRELVEEVAEARPDTPAALWLAERMIDVPFELIEATVADDRWTDGIALGLVGTERVGVVSMGPSTRAVLDVLVDVSAESFTIVAKSAVVVRGLEDLGVDTVGGDPAGADVCLIPIAAHCPDRMWTSASGSDALDRSSRPLVLADPITELSDVSVERFRPAEWLVERTLGFESPRRH